MLYGFFTHGLVITEHADTLKISDLIYVHIFIS
jgi:hypothetical protein